MKTKFIFFFLLFSFIGFSQKTIPEVLKKFKATVPYITVEELKNKKNIILLDTREQKEFDTSHIKDAQCVGFDHFKGKQIDDLVKDKNATIIVYCSIGIRSGMIGDKLLKMGYKNVYNLYGGIFEWKNNGLTVFDSNNKETDNVHAFSKEWSKYLTKGNKVY
jgi:rhodanese-related sulfurtransferase